MTEIRKLDLNLIVVLDALLIEKNLTRAGERVGMTQPAVSGALSRLRELFDDPLLERDGRGFVLTPRAEALIPDITRCMVEVRRTFDVLPDFDPATSERTFLISASDYVLTETTSPLLGLLGERAPGIRVEFTGLRADEMISPVDLLRNDITIVAGGRGIPGKHAALFSDAYVCLADAANPALRDGALDLEALETLHTVRSFFGAHVSTHVDDMYAEAGITPQIALSVREFLPIPFALASTGWIGWVPERIARRHADALGLVIARTPISPSVLVEVAHWHPSKNDDPALQWLVQQLRRVAEVVEFGAEEE